ncbi:hypothetical protein DB347_15375 [Opitutaceae bacterium EW11]|nr:hypothetical protein DB347_15375 [Opitutaceae bacterium EW11]
MRILVVEDHPAVAQTSSALLREVYGHEVECSSTAAGAFEAALRFCPDLILVDLNLPDADGYSLARRLRSEAGFDATRLVALSGWGGLIDTHAVDESGFDAWFRKPMDFEELPRVRRRR